MSTRSKITQDSQRYSLRIVLKGRGDATTLYFDSLSDLRAEGRRVELTYWITEAWDTLTGRSYLHSATGVRTAQVSA